MKKNREERRRDSRRKMELLTMACFLLLLISILIAFLTTTAKTIENEPKPGLESNEGRLPGDDTPATERCYMTAEEIQEDYENYYIEQAILAKAHKIDNVKVSHYCTCEKCCGKPVGHPAYGITSTGVYATPYVTVAVDPDMIQLGSDVLVDYGDGEIHYYKADDTGSAIKGNHIDLCVSSHEEAIQLGCKTATVYWAEVE